MVRICGCEISPSETARLLDLLRADITVESAEAAAAIGLAQAFGAAIDNSEPWMRDVVAHLLADSRSRSA